uniref:Rab3GAP catalytic subunit conserved domain-containing protein n=1 Tax=Manihot esculenta TaxID=3983 RepID=A0A2C9W718_MANES
MQSNEGKHLRWRSAHIGTKQEWQDKLKKIRIGKKGSENHTEKVENPNMAVPFYDENLYILNMKNDAEAKGSQVSFIVERLNSTSPDSIPPTSVMKQLAIAIDAGKKHKSMKDILSSSGGSSPIMERASLSLAAVKSLVLRDKEDKLASEFGGDEEKVSSLIQSLFDVEGKFLKRNISSGLEQLSMSRDIHGAPPESLLAKLSEVIGSFKTLRKMAFIWCKIVDEMRRHWSEERHIPGIPVDDLPDLNLCLLYQKLQVINCCVSRKRRRIIATQSLELVMRDASSCAEQSAISNEAIGSSVILYARLSNGENVLRLGADQPADNLTLLETGEPVYSPITQEGPLLTEDLIKENEEFVLRTGSVGAGCSQLLSDMQAFKAANPGCILEDFVRWHSPPDWTDNLDEDNEFFEGGDVTSSRGQLSSRMQKEGNLWRELWQTAKAIPAIKQAPQFDEDLAVEGILHDLEELSPSELFEQLFISLLGLGILVTESKVSSNNDLSKLFHKCKDYIIFTCQGNNWSEKVDDLCQVYETLEKIVLEPEEVLKAVKQAEEATTPTAGESKGRFKRLGLNFGNKDRNLRKSSFKETCSEISPRQQFSNFFDGKSSLFSKKPPKPESASSGDRTPSSDENDWTIVNP